MVPKTCSIEECTGPTVGRGWCRRHYNLWHRRGTPAEPVAPTAIERFHKAYAKSPSPYGLPAPCWIWKLSASWDYPQFKVDGHQVKGHKFSYQYHHGEIPEGYVVRHKCDRPLCVNPDHLELGTHSDNAQDRTRRNRTRAKKIEQHQVEEIRVLIDQGHMTLVAIADHYGVTPGMIGHIKHGRMRLRPTRPILHRELIAK